MTKEQYEIKLLASQVEQNKASVEYTRLQNKLLKAEVEIKEWQLKQLKAGK